MFLFPNQPDKKFYCIASWLGIFVIVALQVFISLKLPLAADEAYYWYWSKHLAWGYPEHPPMIAFLYRLASYLFGDEDYATRLTSIFFLVLLLFVLYRFGRRLTGRSWTGFLFLSLVCFLPNVIGISFIITTDTPMLFFLFLALFFYTGAFFPSTNSTASTVSTASIKKVRINYILGGIFMGLALLSKLSVVIIIVLISLYALASKRRGKYFKEPFFYLSFIISFLVFLPCLLWIIEHDFIILKQLNYLSNQTTNFGNFINFYKSQIILVGPIAFILIPFLSVKSIYNYFSATDEEAEKFFLFGFISLSGLLYIIIKSFFHTLHPNWTLVFIICAIPLIVLYIDEVNRKIWYYFFGGFHLIIALTFFLMSYFIFSFSASSMKAYPNTIGALTTFYNHKVFSKEFLEYYQKEMDKKLLIATPNYQITSFVNYYWQPNPSATLIRSGNYHLTIFDLLFHEKNQIGKDIYYILPRSVENDINAGNLVKLCKELKILKTFTSSINGVAIYDFDLYQCNGFKGSPYDYPTGSTSIFTRLLFK